MTIEINASKREVQGKGASRRLRHLGRVPGVLYGGGKDAENLEFDQSDLYRKLRQEAFHASVLTLNINGDKQAVLLRDSQMHPWRAEVMHVDFQRVSKDRKIHMKVPLHFINQEVAPGVKTGGGIVSHVLTELDITCLPDLLPEYITVDLGELQLGQTIHLSDIQYPEGVESVALSHGDNQALVTIQVPRGEKEAAKAADAPAPAAAPAKK